MRISVVIPAYNAEPYIACAIESCLQQTEPPDEIVVVDDASSDHTAEIAERFGRLVRVIRLSKNGGLSIARNQGVEASTGDWIAFLDADDWYLPHKLELQKRCIAENPKAIVVYSGFIRRFIDGLEREGAFFSPSELVWRLRYHCAICSCTALVRRNTFEAVMGFNSAYRRCEDWDLWLRIAERFSMESFAAVPIPLYVYRQVPGCLTSNAIAMFNACASIIDTRSLYGKSGLAKRTLRRMIHAFNYSDAALALREAGSDSYFGYLLKSLVLWPFPSKMLPMKRYKTGLVMLMQYLHLRPNPFRLNDGSGR